MQIKPANDLKNPKMTAGPKTVDMAEIAKKAKETAAKQEATTIQGQNQGNMQPGNVNITA